MIHSTIRLVAAAGAVLAASALLADARAAEEPGGGDAVVPEAARSAGAGAFLPFTMGARSDAQRALVYGQGGYDSAQRGAVFQSVVEAQIFGRVALRAGSSYLGPSGDVKPEVGLRVDALRQERHGVDLAALGVYEGQGFNTVKAVTLRVAASRAFGDSRLVSNLGYGLGLEEGEHYGDVRLAALRTLAPNLQLGLDSRFRMDLERDGDEPAGEPDWELAAGPLATYSLGRYLVSASAGFSAVKFRLRESKHLGAVGTLGFGAVF